MQPALQKAPLTVVGDLRDHSRVASRRLLRRPDAAQQIGPRGMEHVVVVQISRFRALIRPQYER